jgi:hypothetical protein
MTTRQVMISAKGEIMGTILRPAWIRPRKSTSSPSSRIRSEDDPTTPVGGQPPPSGDLGQRFTVSARNLNFSWTGGAGIRLQKATSLNPANWADVADSDGASSATKSSAQEARFIVIFEARCLTFNYRYMRCAQFGLWQGAEGAYPRWVCNRRPAPPGGSAFSARLRCSLLQIHLGICSSLAPLWPKNPLAAHVSILIQPRILRISFPSVRKEAGFEVFVSHSKTASWFRGCPLIRQLRLPIIQMLATSCGGFMAFAEAEHKPGWLRFLTCEAVEFQAKLER